MVGVCVRNPRSNETGSMKAMVPGPPNNCLPLLGAHLDGSLGSSKAAGNIGEVGTKRPPMCQTSAVACLLVEFIFLRGLWKQVAL